MRGVNKVILVGNLGKDPEVQHLESGITVTKFSLATSEPYKDKAGNRIDQTEWHNIVVWRQLAEFCAKYLHKGSAIYLEGKIRSRSWMDKDNNKKYTTEIIADAIRFLDRKPDSGSGDMQPAASTADIDDSSPADDLPF